MEFHFMGLVSYLIMQIYQFLKCSVLQFEERKLKINYILRFLTVKDIINIYPILLCVYTREKCSRLLSEFSRDLKNLIFFLGPT